MAIFCYYQVNAQTATVTVYSDDFEDYTAGTNLTDLGYEIWEGAANAAMDASNGYQGSDHYAKSDASKINFTLLKSIYPLNVGDKVVVSLAGNFVSSTPYNPLILTQLDNTGTALSGNPQYYNFKTDYDNSTTNYTLKNGNLVGDDTWQPVVSNEITIVSGAEGVRIQHYRYAKQILKIDNILLQVKNGITWTGATSTDWNTASNWETGAVPAAGSHVLISASANNMPVISTADANVMSLEIADGAKLTVNTGYTLTVTGQLTGAGTGHVEVMSGASLDANRVVGHNHVIKRTTRFSNGRYSIVGSPVKWGNISDLGNPVYSYDEKVTYNSTADNPSTGNNGLDRFIAQTTGTDTLKPGSGYFSANTGMLSFTGLPNYGTIKVGLTYTSQTGTNDQNYEGFNLVSNPYAASISYADFMKLNGVSNSTINQSIWLWDDNGSNTSRGSNGDYITINSMGNVGTQSNAASNLWDGYIRSGQGFFVKATAAGTLLFTDTMRVSGHNSDGGFYRKASTTYSTVKFSVKSADGILYNESLVGFADHATVGIDGLDASKLAPVGDLKLYSLVDNKPLAIQSIPAGLDEVTIPLGLHASKAGTYEFTLVNLKNWDDSYQIVLEDALTGQSTTLSGSNSYSFTASAGTSDRLSLRIAKSILSVSNPMNISVKPELNGLNIRAKDFSGKSLQVTIHDISGRELLRTSVNSNDRFVDYRFSKNSIYIVRIQSDETTYSQKFIIQ